MSPVLFYSNVPVPIRMSQLDELIAAIDLSSVNAGKYKPIIDWLAGELKIPSKSIRCKTIRDDKNIANRLREIAAPVDVLFVIYDAERVAIESIVSRLKDLVAPSGPMRSAIVYAKGQVDAKPNGYFFGDDNNLAVAASSVIGDLERVAPMSSSVREAPPEALVEWCQEPAPIPGPLLGQALESPNSSRHDLVHWLAERAQVPAARVVVKVIGDAKNAGNRIGEAIGLNASLVALVLGPGVERAHVHRMASKKLGSSTTPPKLVVIENESRGWTAQRLEEAQRTLAFSESAPVQESAPSIESAPPQEAVPCPVSELSRRVNSHVTRLKRHNALSASSLELYEERREATNLDQFTVPTRARDFVKELTGNSSVSLIVLTGDAGHGKTHLCRMLLVESCGLSNDLALDSLKKDVGGNVRHVNRRGREIRILPDLSAVEPDTEAARLLAEHLEDHSAISVICANEGRLRAVIDRLPERLSEIRDSLDASIQRGVTATADLVQVINLNHQSVTTEGTDKSFFTEVLHKWVDDGRRWTICGSCTSQTRCPIWANRLFLSENGPAGGTPGKRLAHLVRVAEQCGLGVTFRDALAFLAYTLVGTQDCRTVHDQIDKTTPYHEPTVARLLFEETLLPNQLKQLPVVKMIRRFDPGEVALRSVDDEILRKIDQDATHGPMALSGSLPGSLRQSREEQNRTMSAVRSARRNAFFTDADETTPFWRRLGFEWYGDFETMSGTSEPDPATTKRIRNKLVQGLHVVQGIRPLGEAELYLVDPAFARGRGATSVIAARVTVSKVKVRGESRLWKEQELPFSQARWASEVVDWTERRLTLTLGLEDDKGRNGITLDLKQFEFLCRAASGIAFRSFHGADVRRLVSRLAVAVQLIAPENDRIVVMDGHQPRHLSIDTDDTFVVGEG